MEGTNAAALLCEARLRHGVSQEALAIRAGLTRMAIAEIESGRSPAVQDLKDLLHLLGEDLILTSLKRETGIDLTLNQGNLALSAEQRVQRGLEFADFVRQTRRGGDEGLGRSLQKESENVRRLISALDDLDISLDARLLDEADVFSFDTSFGALDVLGKIAGVGRYEELRRDAHREPIAGLLVQVASLNHLVSMKRASNKRKDQLMAMEYVELADLWRREEER